jgi:hypothetical protein
MNHYDSHFDRYRAVRALVRDKTKSTKEIAEITGYSRGYVSQLRSDIPHVDAIKARDWLWRCAPDLLEALRPIAERGEISAEIIANAKAAIAKATGK